MWAEGSPSCAEEQRKGQGKSALCIVLLSSLPLSAREERSIMSVEGRKGLENYLVLLLLIDG